VPQCRFTVHVPAGDAPVPANAVDLSFNFDGLTVDYLRDLTPVEQVRGVATLDAERFEAHVTSGELGGLHLSAGAVDIRFRGGPPWLKVGADVAGPVQNALAVIEHPPLEIPQAIGIPASNVDGKSSSHVEIELPVKHGVRSSEVAVRVTSELHETRIADLLGTTIEGADLQVRVDGRHVDVDGEAAIVGLPVAVDRTRLAVAFVPGTEGAPDELDVSAEAKDWRTKAKAALQGRSLASLKIEELHIAGSELAAVITRQGAEFRASIDAAVVDVDPFLHPTVPTSQVTQKLHVPFDADFRVQRFKVGKGIDLTAMQGVVRGDGTRLVAAHATASTANAGNVRIDLVERDAARRLEISTSDAGSLLKALGIFEDAEGGDGVLSATLNDRAAKAEVDGQLDVRDFRVTRAPVLARVLSIGSLKGIAELLQGGEGLAFSRAHVPFRWSAGTVEMRDASAIGVIGLTADGRIQRAAHAIELRGHIFPAYTLNSVLGKIPFIGKFITGGEDQGIFGIEFRVSGKLETPEVEVNPLTAFAPGALRKMFVEPFKHDEHEEKREGDQHTDEPPSAKRAMLGEDGPA
jgi:hypothetical protein